MGTTAEKLNYLKETKSEIKNTLETPSNIFRDYPSLIKKYIDNQLTKVVSDGVCSNAVDLPTKAINVDGNSEQKMYSGKNLAYTDWSEDFVNRISDIQKAKIETKDGRNCLYYRGDAGGGNYNAKYLFKTNWKENTQYTISFDIYPSEKYANILLEYTDGTTSYPAKWGWLTVQQWQHLSATSDSNKTIKYIRCEYASGFDYIDLDTFMIKESSVGDDTYEPYVGGMPSPNPSYPQKIKVVDGCNLFYIDKKDITENKWLSYDEQEKTFTIKQGTGVAPEAIPINVNLEAGTTITVSFIMLTGKYTTGLISLGTYHINPNSWQGKIDLPQNEDLAGKTFNSTVTITDTINGFMPFIYSTPTVEEDIVFKIQLTEGTIQKPYLPYGSIGLEQSGKNKFDNKVQAQLINNAKEITLDENKRITLTQATYSYAVFKIKQNISEYAGKTVRLKADFTKSNSNLNPKYGVLLGDANYSEGRQLMGESPVSGYTINFNLPSIFENGKEYLYIRLYATVNKEGNIDDYVDFNNIILTINNEDMTYEPYHEPKVIPIDLQGNTLAKVGDIKDILRVNRSGEVEIKKNIWEETINTSSLITLSNNNKALFFKTSKKKATDVRNDNYLVTNAQRNQTFNDGTVYQNPANFVFVGSPTDTLEIIKAKFNGGKILYQLATPQIITLPSISPIELWQGTNIFKLITNLDTTFEVEYVVNKDSVLNEVQTAMLEAEIEI